MRVATQDHTSRPGLTALLSSIGPSVWLAATILAFWILVALFAPWISPYPPSEMIAPDSFVGPNAQHWLGSDVLQRDVLSRLIYGSRMTLGLGLIATCSAFAGGMTLGFAAAVLGGRCDMLLSRVVDAFLSFPSIMLSLVVISSLGTSLTVVVVTIAFIESTRVFRVARAVAMDIAVMDFVEVARARGESSWWIMMNEILPNSFVPIATDFGLRFTYSILLLSSLSFLGLGVRPPEADWGGMVRENLAGVHVVALATIAPALAILSVTVAVNYIVDWNLSQRRGDIARELRR